MFLAILDSWPTKVHPRCGLRPESRDVIAKDSQRLFLGVNLAGREDRQVVLSSLFATKPVEVNYLFGIYFFECVA